MIRWALVAVVVALALAAGAGAATPTHAQFVRQLDAVCQAGNRGPTLTSINQLLRARRYRQAAALVEAVYNRPAQLRALDRIVAPAADAAKFARYKLLTHRIVGLGLRGADALRGGDVELFNRLARQLNTLVRQRTLVAIDLGTRHCGQ